MEQDVSRNSRQEGGMEPFHTPSSIKTEDVEGSESCHIKSTAVVGGKDPKSQGSYRSRRAQM